MRITPSTPRNLFVNCLIIAVFFIFAAIGSAENTHADIKKEKFNDSKSVEDEIGYTQAVKVGKTLYISGTVGEGDLPAQIKSIYEDINKVLSKYGATFQNVVKENVFT